MELSKRELKDGLLRVHRVRQKTELSFVRLADLGGWFYATHPDLKTTASAGKKLFSSFSTEMNTLFVPGEREKGENHRDGRQKAAHAAVERMMGAVARGEGWLVVTELRLSVVREVNGLVVAERVGDVGRIEVIFCFWRIYVFGFFFDFFT